MWPSSPVSRREFLAVLAAAATSFAMPTTSVAAIQEGPASLPPIPEHHFPDRLHLFIWRNWEIANVERMAEVLKTTPGRILEIGESMGLPPKPRLTEDQLRRIYITVIRQNWHVIPDDQIIQLLGWDREHFEFALKEDDFLSVKLGRIKPDCQPLYYSPPSDEARRRAAEIREAILGAFGRDNFLAPGEAPFSFVQTLADGRSAAHFESNVEPRAGEVSLSGWKLVTQLGSTDLAALAERFHQYLSDTFRCKTELVMASTDAFRALSFQLETTSVGVRDSFTLEVESDQVRVRANDPLGLQRAVYRMQLMMEARGGPLLPLGTIRLARRLTPCYLYSYFALYGDPLMEEEIDPFPAGYLEKLARLGVNGVWLQAVLRNMAPSSEFSEFGSGWQQRQKRIAELVRRASEFGIQIFLYINEPRTMPTEFFDRYPELKGTFSRAEPNFHTMCTSVPRVRRWIEESLTHIFKSVPGLGGIFTISMSENLTHCYSKGRPDPCPRCSQRPAEDVLAELHHSFVKGVKAGSPDARIITWDWGWGYDWVRNGVESEKLIPKLPKEVELLSVSEWDAPVHRGGVSTEVGEYSMSVVGPGPRASRNWTIARQHGLRTMAKVQINATWEISAVPYIPVPNLIERHIENLIRVGVDGLMLSWTVGGYPSPNLEVAQEYYYWPVPDKEKVIPAVARRRYGEGAEPYVLRAWEAFSRAFEEFPYGVHVYIIPTQHGPANLLRLDETGFDPGMILFPHDAYKRWSGDFPPDIALKQFRRMAELWNSGLEDFRKALPLVTSDRQEQAAKDLGIAETCYIHFESVANQLEFYILRDRLGEDGAAEHRSRMQELAASEAQLAKRLYTLARQDSTLGYEATNHYYYRPLDLAEKILNCEEVIARLRNG